MSRINTDTTRAGQQEQAAGQLYDACADIATISKPVVGAAVQITTVAVSSASDDTDYTLSIGEDSSSLTAITANSGTSATTTTIAAALVAAINASADVNPLVFASNSGATITIRSRRAGESFTVSESDGNLGTPSTTQSAAEPTSIAFGLLCALSSSPDGCEVINSSDFTAKVYDVTPTYDDGDLWTVNITWRGKTYSHTVDMATSLAVSIDAMVEALNNMMPASSVLAGDGATKMTLTSELPGVDFTVTSTTSDVSDAGNTVAVTVAVATANARPALAGISRKAHTLEQDSNGDAAFGRGSTVSCLRQGRIWVRLDDDHTISALTDDVYVRHTAAGTEKAGAFRSSADSTDCLLLSDYGWKGRWLTLHKTGFNSNTIAALEISPL